MTQTPHLFVVKEQEVKNVADPSRNHGVYALSWRFANEPPLTRHWAYYLTSEEMEAALARSRDEGTVITSTGWLSVDDMLMAG
jgi:hypothetical protein